MKLGDHLVRQDKGVEVGLAHGARHLVEQRGELRPMVQKREETLRLRVVWLVKRIQRERRELELGDVW